MSHSPLVFQNVEYSLVSIDLKARLLRRLEQLYMEISNDLQTRMIQAT